MHIRPAQLTFLLCSLLASLQAFAAKPEAAEKHEAATCIVPAKPGGGMDLTCKLAQQATVSQPMQINYLPGGVGAIAWTTIITQRKAEANTLVAYSGGSLLNLAEGKFGKSDASHVRWVAAIGTDYGMIAVRKDSPYKNLRELMDAIKSKPANIAIGAGGTVGSQDWLKMAQIGKQAGIDSKTMRLVAFEGGGNLSQPCWPTMYRPSLVMPLKPACMPVMTRYACWPFYPMRACPARWRMYLPRGSRGLT